MTYRELKIALEKIADDDLDQPCKVFDENYGESFDIRFVLKQDRYEAEDGVLPHLPIIIAP